MSYQVTVMSNKPVLSGQYKMRDRPAKNGHIVSRQIG